ncbi:DUF6924 domain-containing protein [Streptomyces sp. NPDC002690]
MRDLPAFEPAEGYADDGFDPVVIRTDYTDDEAWRATVAGLCSLWGEGSEVEAWFHLIDDPPAREFRTVPGEVHGVQVGLALANVDFQECAGMASEDPEGVLRTP